MNYYNIIKNDINNGDNFRVSLFVTGCKFNCCGCWNKELQNPCAGKLFTEDTKKEIFDEVSKSYYGGISLLGGEITHENNIDEITKLCKEFKETFSNKTIFAWTGQDWENVKNMEFVKYVDVLIDGRFILAQRNLKCKWRGSENQRVIDVQESLKQGKIVLYCE